MAVRTIKEFDNFHVSTRILSARSGSGHFQIQMHHYNTIWNILICAKQGGKWVRLEKQRNCRFMISGTILFVRIRVLIASPGHFGHPGKQNIDLSQKGLFLMTMGSLRSSFKLFSVFWFRCSFAAPLLVDGTYQIVEHIRPKSFPALSLKGPPKSLVKLIAGRRFRLR